MSRRRVLQAAGSTAAALPLLALPTDAEAAAAKPEASPRPELPSEATYEAAYREAFHQVWRAGFILHRVVAEALAGFRTIRVDDAILLYVLAKDLRHAHGDHFWPPHDLRRRLAKRGLGSVVSTDTGYGIELTEEGEAVVRAIEKRIGSSSRHMRFFGPELAALAGMRAPLLQLEREWMDIVRYQL